MDMLAVLGDIELAQKLAKEQEEKEKTVEEVDHPLDAQYKLLKSRLTYVKPGSKEYKYIDTYIKNTGPDYMKLEILDVFEVDRDGEDKKFKAHDAIKHRKLLWHGTNVAVVVAILSSGLRIMPHSGGRVGRGLYFASENSKSAGYVGCAGNIGFMFLNEVALGKEHEIDADDSSLVTAPKGYDSIVARGWVEPDPKEEITVKFDGKDVIVPQGKPVKQAKWNKSRFSQSEYLVYKENQVRIRYILKLKFGN